MIQIAAPQIGPEEVEAVLEVLASGMLAQGPVVRKFEDAFAGMCGVQHAVATSSGTTALHTALLAHEIGVGDEVITSPFTFIASANSILFTGARPVFVDIDPRTFNLDPGLIESAITSRTRAIMPVHLFGLTCDMDPILEIAEKHDLVVIEDACQSHGATYHGRKAGSFGTGTFSLYPTKNITSAEGGMITTNDPHIAEQCRIIRQHGMSRQYFHEQLGFNFRMSDVHAAIGYAQLSKLEHYNSRRRQNAAVFDQALEEVITPWIPGGHGHVYHQYTLRVPGKRRDALKQHLEEAGVRSAIYYPIPIHKQPYYTAELGYALNLPESERAAEEVLSLPVHPGLSESDLDCIIKSVNEFMVGKIDASQ